MNGLTQKRIVDFHANRCLVFAVVFALVPACGGQRIDLAPNTTVPKEVWTNAVGVFFRADLEPAFEQLVRQDLPVLQVSVGCLHASMRVRREPDGRRRVTRATIEEISLLQRPRFESSWVLPWSRALEERIAELDLETPRARALSGAIA